MTKTNVNYNPVSVTVDTSKQALAQMAQLDAAGLKRLAAVYGAQALEHGKSLPFFRTAAIISGLATVISGMGVLNGNRESFPFWFILGCAAGLTFLFTAYAWADLSSKVANANIWQQHCITMLEAS